MVAMVASTGTDWPAVVAAISTGVVGLAGIVGTFRSGKRSINAENERARLAEKRRIYAAYHASLGGYRAFPFDSEQAGRDEVATRARLCAI